MSTLVFCCVGPFYPIFNRSPECKQSYKRSAPCQPSKVIIAIRREN
ncbi:hypothetical protein E2C01_032998 [Portunus trituberculatus]|uniref:Uncharacterized protein n=1 Tax=Portunus trituberculatus TaxID=210409 RepID=A0A5B7EXE6_PORTR|nr:hypothetical protein [Portunus trituberculatus]